MFCTVAQDIKLGQNKAVFSEEDFQFFAGVNDCCLTPSFSAITWRDQVTF